MANHFRLYERPLMADETEAALTVTGVLEGYTSGEAYESRLQINNSIGRCTVEIVEANLPPGAAVRVDNVTKEVVVKWDAFEVVAEELNAVPNGDFEEGDNGQWYFGNGWSIEAGGAETGTYSGVFQNFKGISSIESVRLPYTPGTPIKGQCRFQQGASSKGNLVGRALLIWCDANGNMLPGGEGVSFTGGYLIRSGSNGEWKTSTVTGASREAAMVAIGFNCNRKKQNRLARVDNFTWNHKYTLGQVGDDTYFLHIKVTDSLNRVAYWKGNIEEYGIFITSQLYGFYQSDQLSASSAFVRYTNVDMLPPEEYTLAASSFGSWEFKNIRNEYTADPESVQATSAFVGWELKSIRKEYNVEEPETVIATSGFHSFTLKQHPVVNQPLDATVISKSGFVSWSFV
ncbi:hypothetical protein IVIADoCa4_46 [Xanthomonas phage vB_Xar_IVIA-DoCa4]|uniref:Tail fiber protein n=1 Tax=Xanthomonas phage vB_Xar_IVIA-DoCa4 TaxID=2975531 RepID=A0A9X9JQG6_9CAUD|nr:hypothetical protein IVIADoCa4_46 [Xanthomonas phage vB_Xar_IVIA-DoCa4]